MKNRMEDIQQKLEQLRGDLSDLTHDIDEYMVSYFSGESYNLKRAGELEKEREALYKKIDALECDLKKEMFKQQNPATSIKQSQLSPSHMFATSPSVSTKDGNKLATGSDQLQSRALKG